MTHQDKLSIMITFVVGFVIGGYVYLAGFLPTYHLPEAVTPDAYESFVIVGDSYGACAALNSCLSFQLLDRDYRAIFGTGDEAQVVNGSISGAQMRKLLRTLTPEALALNATPLTMPECRFAESGTDFRLTITLEGRNYTLDTCVSAIQYDGPVWIALTEVWADVASEIE
jgi:hypothetical protein